ncbi:hypothetical protein AeMF1_015437 [Aphanomyces euteiches]|nr:hypothetical protein AeMF1_015437 [Aphanomyces euteiches]
MLLDDNNWNLWRTHFRGRLLAKGLWYIIDEAMDSDTQSTPYRITEDSTRKSHDSQALGLLIQSISSSQYQYVQDATKVWDAYKSLADHHEPKTRIDRIAASTEYYNMKWNLKQETLPQFLERHDVILRRLRACGSEVTITMQIDHILQLMPWELRHVMHQVSSDSKLQRNFLAVRALLETEYKAALKCGAINHPRGSSNDDRALNAQDNSRKRTGKCHWCQKEGHWADKCKARRAGKPKKGTPYTHGTNVRANNDQNHPDSGNRAIDTDVWLFADWTKTNLIPLLSIEITI